MFYVTQSQDEPSAGCILISVKHLRDEIDIWRCRWIKSPFYFAIHKRHVTQKQSERNVESISISVKYLDEIFHDESELESIRYTDQNYQKLWSNLKKDLATLHSRFYQSIAKKITTF